MPATPRLTRKQVRQRIGVASGAINLDGGAIEHTIDEAVSAAVFRDATLPFGTTDEHRGKWVVWTDSGSSVETRRISASNPDDQSITLSVPLGATPTSSGTYELWERESNPVAVHSFINDAITEVSRKGAVTVESDSFHTGGGIQAFTLDSAWMGVRSVEWRSSYKGVTLATMDAAPDSLTATTAVALDSQDYREGTGAVRLTVAAGESSGTAIANSSFAAVDIRGYDRVEFWYKTSGAITSSGFVLQLMQGSSAQVAVSLPASSGDRWVFHTASISSPENNSSVTAVQVSTGSSDMGASVVWLDHVRATRRYADVFSTVPRDFWEISQQNREVRIEQFNQPYAMLRITGVRRPNELNSDSDVCEVDPNYVINHVRAQMLLAGADNNAGQRDAAAIVGRDYIQLSQLQRNRMSMPSNVRWLQDP